MFVIRLISTENLFVEPKREGVALNVTQLCSGESMNFSTYFGRLLLHRKETSISLLQSVEARRPLLTKG